MRRIVVEDSPGPAGDYDEAAALEGAFFRAIAPGTADEPARLGGCIENATAFRLGIVAFKLPTVGRACLDRNLQCATFRDGSCLCGCLLGLAFFALRGGLLLGFGFHGP